MPIHKIQRELRANKPKLICSVLRCAVWEIIVIKAFNCNTLLTFSALQKMKLNAMLLLYCLWCQYYACWTNKHNLKNIKLKYILFPIKAEHMLNFRMISEKNLEAGELKFMWPLTVYLMMEVSWIWESRMMTAVYAISSVCWKKLESNLERQRGMRWK